MMYALGPCIRLGEHSAHHYSCLALLMMGSWIDSNLNLHMYAALYRVNVSILLLHVQLKWRFDIVAMVYGRSSTLRTQFTCSCIPLSPPPPPHWYIICYKCIFYSSVCYLNFFFYKYVSIFCCKNVQLKWKFNIVVIVNGTSHVGLRH